MLSGTAMTRCSARSARFRLESRSYCITAIWIGINVRVRQTVLAFNTDTSIQFRHLRYPGPEAIPPKLVKLFGLIELLYSVGARNFMFIDIPPTNRAPASEYA